MPLQDVQTVTGVSVPDSGYPTITPGGKEAAVGAEGAAYNRSSMPLQGVQTK